MSDIKTVQLTDKDGNAISPFTPLSAVYYAYGEQGNKKLVNMETQFGSMDIERINNTHEEAIDSIITLSGESIEYVTQNKNFYDDSIYALSSTTQMLYDKQNPYVVSTTITPKPQANGATTFDFKYELKEKGSSIVGEYKTTITAKHNGSESIDELDGKVEYNTRLKTYSGFTVTYGYDRITAKCERTSVGGVYPSKSESSTVSAYYFIYGVSDKDSGLTENDAKELDFKYASSFGTVSIQIIQEKPWAWFLTPDPIYITGAKSGSYSFTLNTTGMNAETISIGGHMYRMYRSLKPQNPSIWNVDITVAQHN